MKTSLKTIQTITFFLALFLFFSCGGPDKALFEVIPEKATAVITVHPGNLIEKGNLTELEMLSLDETGNEVLREIAENPESSGIDLNRHSYAFFMAEEEQTFCLVMPVKNKSDLEATFSALEEEEDFEFERGKLEGMEALSTNDVFILYDNNMMMSLSMRKGWGELDKMATELLTLEKENQLLADKDFNNFLGKQKDVNAWFTTTNLQSLPGMGDLEDAMDLFGSLKNNYGHVFLEFEKGEMTLTTNLRLNPDMEETVEKYNFLDEKAIKELLTYLPSKDLLFVANTNMDPVKIFDLLEFVNDDFDRIIEEISRELDISEDDIKTVFSGEVAFSLNGLKKASNEEEFRMEVESNVPVITGAARLQKPMIFKKFLEAAVEEGEIEKNGDIYETRGNQWLMLLLSGNDVIISNKKEHLEAISSDGEIAENVTRAEYADILTQNPICFFLNLDQDTYDGDLKNFIDRRMSGRMGNSIETFGKELKSLSFSANLEEWQIKLKLQNEDEYALETILSQLDK